MPPKEQDSDETTQPSTSESPVSFKSETNIPDIYVILTILTHLAYGINAKNDDIYQTVIHSFERARKARTG